MILFLLITPLFILHSLGLYCFVRFYQASNILEFVPGKAPENNHSYNLLLTCTAQGFGGAEMHFITLYQNLVQQDVNVFLLVAKDSEPEKELAKRNIPYYRCASFRYRILSISFHPGTRALKKLIQMLNIDIIHCNEEVEVRLSKKLARNGKIKVFFTRHIPSRFKKSSLKNITGAIGVSKEITNILKTKNQENELQIKNIIQIPPLFDAEKFLTFKTNETKDVFFKKHFGITLIDAPLLCMVANFYSNFNHKNHPLLFLVIHDLIYKRKKKLQVALAGDGVARQILENMLEELKITDYVYFLGFTDKVTDILYHCDINVLSSKGEGLPISLMEASLMRKPSVAANAGGMPEVIKHNQTGLLFENDNAKDLADKIEYLLDNPELVQKFGGNAHEFVKTNLSPQVSTQKYMQLYKRAINPSSFPKTTSLH